MPLLSRGSDGSSLLYPIFFLLGAGSLFPWNAFINASSYFGTRFCGSARSDDFLSFFGITSSLFSCVSLGLCVRYGFKEVVTPLTIYAGIFVITAVLVLIKNVEADFLFLYTLVSLAVVGSCGAFMSGGIFGLAAIFPPIYTQAIMSGQGLAGLIVSLASITTTAIAPPPDSCDSDYCKESGFCDDDDGGSGGGSGSGSEDASPSPPPDGDGCEEYTTNWSAFIYFCFAIGILVVCIFSYLTLERLPITKYYKDLASNPGAAASPRRTPNTADEGEGEGEGVGDGDGSESLTAPLLDVNASSDRRSSSSLSSKASSSSAPSSVFRSVLPLAVAVFAVFAVSLSIFPSYTTKVMSASACRPSGSRFYNDLWVPFSFVMFNVGDFAGRQVPLLFPLASSPPASLRRSVTLVAALSALRVLFVPLFLLCNVEGTVLPVVFDEDFAPNVFMLLLSLSNGAVASYAMMLGPAAVRPADGEKAGNVMVLSLQTGLLVGSAASFFVLKIGTGKW